MSIERIERIVNSGHRAVFSVTGGGSGALHALLTTPGASRFIADARIPYSPEALAGFLGETPEQSVSPATARALAGKAFFHSTSGREAGAERQQRNEVQWPTLENSGEKVPGIGISCTAALQTDRERRGDDRAFICIKTEQAEKLYSLHFSRTSREEQEAFLSQWLLVLVAQAVGAERGLMLPGSFHPVHQGHVNLLMAAEEIACLHGVFELSCVNVDKSKLPEDEVLRRAAVIKDIPVAWTRAPRFTQKAALFPNTTFALGHDTAIRLLETAEGDEWNLFHTLETSFLVAGRQLHCGAEGFQPLEKKKGGGSASFQGLESLTLPIGFESLFEPIPEAEFREDISSTELRNGS